MGRVIAILSGKGGVGKTTVTAGLGEALANLGASVCLVDFDFGLSNLDLMLNVEDRIVYDLSDCLSGRARLKQALVGQKQKSNLYYLPSGKIKSIDAIDLNVVKELVEKISKVFDYCIIDCPAGMGKGFDLVKSVAYEFVVVATPNLSSLRDASKIKNDLMAKLGIEISVLVNRVRGDLVASGKMLDEMQISKALGLKLAGVIPDNDDIATIGNLKSVYDCGEQSRAAFDILARNINFNKSLRFDYLSKYKGVLGAIKCRIKQRA